MSRAIRFKPAPDSDRVERWESQDGGATWWLKRSYDRAELEAAADALVAMQRPLTDDEQTHAREIADALREDRPA